MSKIIVIALLAGNLILLAVRAAQPPEMDGPLSPVFLPAETPPIVLLSEMTSGQSGSDQQCFSIGPFETLQSSERAQAQLAPLVQSLERRESESLVELGYWVSLPAAEDFAAAGEDLRRLQKAGLQDLAVVTDSDDQFRVSLGYFLDEANARRRRDAVRDLGFDAETRLQRQVEARYWLDYRQPATALPAIEQLGDDLAAHLHRAIPCA